MLRRANENTFKYVRYFVVGAEKLQPDLEREFKERCGVTLLEGYGLTEAAPVCSVNVPNAPMITGSAFYVPGQNPRSIGVPLPGVAVRITDGDDDTRELPLTEQGMIWLKGANIFTGYVGKADMNPTIFKDGWFKTGDIGKMDLNGFITLGGRLSRFSKIGGEMVPHEGVEQALTEIFNIDPAAEGGVQIAITGVTDPQKGEALVLLSALSAHQRNSEEKEILQSIRNALNERQMPTLWAPKYIVPVEAIPILPTGKLDLRSCKLLAEEALA
jgi:acyl-[acyl-carrier-protein]-phospholipid O-acyltransferase/long-chain-fatty-acid--[acyl-carrier-protein] ligase